MAKMSAADLLRAMTGDTPPQCVMICGEDTLSVQQIEKKITRRLTDGDALSTTVFDGQEPDLDRLADACGFCPMFQPYNLLRWA